VIFTFCNLLTEVRGFTFSHGSVLYLGFSALLTELVSDFPLEHRFSSKVLLLALHKHHGVPGTCEPDQVPSCVYLYRRTCSISWVTVTTDRHNGHGRSVNVVVELVLKVRVEA
jgi:hypothetical protein